METLESRSCLCFFVPSLASWSARSFPLTLTCPGTQWMWVVIFAFLSVWMLLRALRMYSWPGNGITEQAMVYLLEEIHGNWTENKHTAAAYMDVEGAFDNMDHDTLIRTLEYGVVPPYLTT